MHRKKTFIFAILLNLSLCALGQSLPSPHPYQFEYQKMIESVKRFCQAFEEKKDSILAVGPPKDNYLKGSVLSQSEKEYIRAPFLNEPARDTLIPWALGYTGDIEAGPNMNIRYSYPLAGKSTCGEGVTSIFKVLWYGQEEIQGYLFNAFIEKADLVCGNEAYYGISMRFECYIKDPEAVFQIYVSFIDYNRKVDHDRHRLNRY